MHFLLCLSLCVFVSILFSIEYLYTQIKTIYFCLIHLSIQDTCIGGTSRRDAEKAGSVHSIDSRQFYETEVEKQKFIRENFKLDSNPILDKDAELKEDVIKLFLDNFKVLATHPSQYGETNVLEMKIDLIPGAVPYKSRVKPLNPD